jgi:hypothetical protein
VTEPRLRLQAVDVFGAAALPRGHLLAALGLEEGQDWQHELVEPAWERLAQSFDLADLRLTPVGYGDERIFLTVDLVEPGQPAFDWRAPAGDVEVAPALREVLARYNETRETFWLLNRDPDERVSEEGHFASADEALARIEHEAARLIDADLPAAIAALRDSSDEELRAGLAYLLAWAADRQRAGEALVAALADESGWVRNNAARALLPLALRAARRRDVELPLEPLAALLAAPSTLDRARAATLLGLLAESPAARAFLRAHARPALRAMARLRQPNNRAPAQALLAMLALDAAPPEGDAPARRTDLELLGRRVAEARSVHEVAALADPDPAAPAHRQLADSVFPAPDEQVEIAARLHSARQRDEFAELLLALDIATPDSRRRSAACYIARRRDERWYLWSVGDEATPSG